MLVSSWFIYEVRVLVSFPSLYKVANSLNRWTTFSLWSGSIKHFTWLVQLSRLKQRVWFCCYSPRQNWKEWRMIGPWGNQHGHVRWSTVIWKPVPVCWARLNKRKARGGERQWSSHTSACSACALQEEIRSLLFHLWFTQ